ncbi:hypothetical protein FLL45_01375 [Aliikangiella marina]|uniref:Uncharacterized protein n=1 Tax=Aliikangiella marina TaxID=1712262 RepID=A0A545THD4_9GAMM|nr:hypothetical protein [Aliikangiella marina]TQV76637.1 hypothetical protein FLL45_01375 [Aliikangiella marina]
MSEVFETESIIRCEYPQDHDFNETKIKLDVQCKTVEISSEGGSQIFAQGEWELIKNKVDEYFQSANLKT